MFPYGVVDNWAVILGYLGILDIVRAAGVCRAWRSLIQANLPMIMDRYFSSLDMGVTGKELWRILTGIVKRMISFKRERCYTYYDHTATTPTHMYLIFTEGRCYRSLTDSAGLTNMLRSTRHIPITGKIEYTCDTRTRLQALHDKGEMMVHVWSSVSNDVGFIMYNTIITPSDVKVTQILPLVPRKLVRIVTACVEGSSWTVLALTTQDFVKLWYANNFTSWVVKLWYANNKTGVTYVPSSVAGYDTKIKGSLVIRTCENARHIYRLSAQETVKLVDDVGDEEHIDVHHNPDFTGVIPKEKHGFRPKLA